MTEHSASGREPLTALLGDWGRGDDEAADRLLAEVYAELHRIARVTLRGEREGGTLSATVLVHETYLRLLPQRAIDWQNRSHFFGVAGRTMRRVLLDHVRSRRRLKRGGEAVAVVATEAVGAAPGPPTAARELPGLLARLAALDRRKAEVVRWHFLAGLSVQETAARLGCSTATVVRDWRMARAWLSTQLSGAAP